MACPHPTPPSAIVALPPVVTPKPSVARGVDATLKQPKPPAGSSQAQFRCLLVRLLRHVPPQDTTRTAHACTRPELPGKGEPSPPHVGSCLVLGMRLTGSRRSAGSLSLPVLSLTPGRSLSTDIRALRTQKSLPPRTHAVSAFQLGAHELNEKGGEGRSARPGRGGRGQDTCVPEFGAFPQPPPLPPLP